MYDGSGQEYVRAELLPPDSSRIIDWRNKPSEFKLYQNCAQLPLPFGPSQNHHEAGLTLGALGELLADSYGLLQQHYTTQALDTAIAIPRRASFPAFRRPVPSGGALFPCEIYLFSTAGQALPTGIYHYDVAHHALDILEQCDITPMVCACLARPEVTPPAYILALSCFFWKDGFKYDDFSYRLQGFDLGKVIAQCLAVLERQAIAATVHYQFLDENIDALLGLDPQHESIYALLTVASAPEATPVPPHAEVQLPSPQEMPSASQLTSIAYWPLVEAVHRDALFTTREQFHPLACLPEIVPPPTTTSYALPSVSEEPALVAGYRQRHSANGRFVPISIDIHPLARLCRFSSVGYQSDLNGQTATLGHTLLYCFVNRVKGMPQGIYCYDPATHTLGLVLAGDTQAALALVQLQSSLVNVYDLSVCFFLVGDYNAGFHVYGDRWYRMQNMEAGMIVQRLYLAAATLGLGCRASLDFHQSSARTFLQLPEQWHALIQIMIAPEASPYGYYALPIYP